MTYFPLVFLNIHNSQEILFWQRDKSTGGTPGVKRAVLQAWLRPELEMRPEA